MIDWLKENQENYVYGIPRSVPEAPWMFVVSLSDKAKEVTLSAIEKGLKINSFKIFSSKEELLSQYKGRVSFAKCLVFVSDESPSEDFPLFAVDYFRGNPTIWINSLDDSDVSKRRFWNLLKELNRYAS
jgi:hypothetical protein